VGLDELEAEDSSIKTLHTLAKANSVDSYFANRADAKAEAQRLLGLYKADRALYRITIKARGFTLEIGDVVVLKHPRWGLANGRPFLVVALKADAQRNRVSLTCWG